MKGENPLQPEANRKPRDLRQGHCSTEKTLLPGPLCAYCYYKRVAKRLHFFSLFLPDTDFAIETDSPRMKSRACIFNHIFRINRFPRTMSFNDFRPVRIQGLRERVDHVFICVLGGNQVHRPYVHTGERFCLSFVGIRGNSYSVKEGIIRKEGLLRGCVKRNEEDVLRSAGLRGSGCRDSTTDECSSSLAVR